MYDHKNYLFRTEIIEILGYLILSLLYKTHKYRKFVSWLEQNLINMKKIIFLLYHIMLGLNTQNQRVKVKLTF